MMYTFVAEANRKNVEKQFKAAIRRNRQAIYTDLLIIDTLYKGEEMRYEGSKELASKLVSTIVFRKEEREDVIGYLTSVIYDILDKEDSMSLLKKANIPGVDLHNNKVRGYDVESSVEMQRDIEERVNNYNKVNNTNKEHYVVADVESRLSPRYVKIAFVDVVRADGSYYFNDLIRPKYYIEYAINRLRDDPLISRYRVVIMTVKRKFIPRLYEDIYNLNTKIYMEGYKEAYIYQLEALVD